MQVSRKKKMVVASAAVVAAALALTGGVAASGVIDSDEPITGDALVEASRVALEHTGEGRVTGTEVGDEDSYYEIEVTLDDGTEVDVQLDENFAVVGAEADGPDGTDELDEAEGAGGAAQ